MLQQVGAKGLDSCGCRWSRNLQVLGKPFKALYKGKYLSEAIISQNQGSRHNCILWVCFRHSLEMPRSGLSLPGNFLTIRVLDLGDIFFWMWLFKFVLSASNLNFLVRPRKSSLTWVNSDFLIQKRRTITIWKNSSL